MSSVAAVSQGAGGASAPPQSSGSRALRETSRSPKKEKIPASLVGSILFGCIGPTVLFILAAAGVGGATGVKWEIIGGFAWLGGLGILGVVETILFQRRQKEEASRMAAFSIRPAEVRVEARRAGSGRSRSERARRRHARHRASDSRRTPGSQAASRGSRIQVLPANSESSDNDT